MIEIICRKLSICSTAPWFIASLFWWYLWIYAIWYYLYKNNLLFAYIIRSILVYCSTDLLRIIIRPILGSHMIWQILWIPSTLYPPVTISVKNLSFHMTYWNCIFQLLLLSVFSISSLYVIVCLWLFQFPVTFSTLFNHSLACALSVLPSSSYRTEFCVERTYKFVFYSKTGLSTGSCMTVSKFWQMYRLGYIFSVSGFMFDILVGLL